jgi:hypothetical protein
MYYDIVPTQNQQKEKKRQPPQGKKESQFTTSLGKLSSLCFRIQIFKGHLKTQKM